MHSLRGMIRYMRPYQLVLWLGLLTVILPVAMELLVPRILQFVIDQGIRADNMGVVVQGSLLMLATAVVGAVATLVQGFCRARLSQGMAYDMRNELFAHVQALSFANLDQLQTGQLMTRISSDVDVVRMFNSAGLALLLRAVLMILGSVIMLLITDWWLTLVTLFFLAIAGVVIGLFMRLSGPLFGLVQQRLAALNTVVQENLAGVHVVRAFVRERFEIARFRAQNEELMGQNIQVGRLLSLVMPILTVITNLGSVAIIWLGGLDVIGNRLTIGELIAFNNYLMIGMAPLLLLGNILMMVSRADTSAQRILEVLVTEPAIRAVPTPYRSTQMAGHLRFQDVAFHYAGRGGETGEGGASSRNGHQERADQGEDVLRGVTLEIKPGQQVALLGATGAGKSTMVHLISRFYDVTGGTVSVDGVDVRQWAPDALRGQIGIVLQQTTLFSGTVRQNIAYGRPEASMEAVVAAARAAQAHDFIMAMPEGYDSPVEARGTNLSGGQKQRIAVARALLIAPAILILDDSTSAVDLETEFRIQQALESQQRRLTTLIVAQRITSVVNADQILLLEEGMIAAQGTHGQLLRSSPIYQEIYRSQFGELPESTRQP